VKHLVVMTLVFSFASCGGNDFRKRVMKQRKQLVEKAEDLSHEMAPEDVLKVMGQPEAIWRKDSRPKGYTFPSGVEQVWAYGVDLPFGPFRRSVVEVNFSRTPAGSLRAWQVYVNGYRIQYDR